MQSHVSLGAYTIRRMRAGDIDSIMRIESVSFGRFYWSPESFANEMKSAVGRYYVLCDEVLCEDQAPEAASTVIGYCGFWVLDDEAHLTTIAVSQQYRGKALGELLLQHIIERCVSQSVRRLTLEVRSSNTPAQKLYYKYGFSLVGVRPCYYQDTQEDAMILTTLDMLTDEFRQLLAPLREVLLQQISQTQGFGIS